MRLGFGAARRATVILAIASAMIPFASGPAHAAAPLPIACTAAGSITVSTLGTTWHWELLGKGSCEGDLQGTYFLDFVGSGTSDTLGICDGTGLVQNLDLTIHATLTNANTLIPKNLVQTWSAPVTTYPVATAFLVDTTSGPGGPGAGVFFNHIFLQCPGNPLATTAGSPVAQFDWAFLT